MHARPVVRRLRALILALFKTDRHLTKSSRTSAAFAEVLRDWARNRTGLISKQNH